MTHYIPSNEKDEKEILETLEISSFEDLIKIIPKRLRIKEGILGLEEGISELELTNFIDSRSRLSCFLVKDSLSLLNLANSTPSSNHLFVSLLDSANLLIKSTSSLSIIIGLNKVFSNIRLDR